MRSPCGDYRLLNLQTQPDLYTRPNIADPTARLEGCTIFSKLDLCKGFHQIPVMPRDVPKTAVITPFGLWEFIHMPFGLQNAGQIFQCFVDEVLDGLEFCFVYNREQVPGRAYTAPEGGAQQAGAARHSSQW